MMEFICPKCGKNFIPAPMHVYKDNGKVYCSWTCYNHRNDAKLLRKAKAVVQYTKQGEYINTFPNANIAAMQTNCIACHIREACRLHKSYKGYIWRYQNDLP